MIYTGDALSILRTMTSESVNCIVTSPPYYGLRDYGQAGQIGHEPEPGIYINKLVDVFREARRVLRDDGTLWLNLGDIYGKSKNLIGVPWRVAFALQEDGWNLRQDIIWSKLNPMPESVSDRCTKSHEYIFLLTKSRNYYFDTDAIAEKAHRAKNDWRCNGSAGTLGHGNRGGNKYGDNPDEHMRTKSGNEYTEEAVRRNKRSVWTTAVARYKGAHFATYPPELIRPCIKAGCPAGGVVLDPFFGSGTTGVVAIEEGRQYIGIELNPKYVDLARQRLAAVERTGAALF